MEVGDKLNLQRSYRKGFALKGLQQLRRTILVQLALMNY